ncbi:uncharacterized protein [Antedon mediterranea]|uniref:uncharacterized protein n=1 Tax=Antedon mediterranea TaxID=105859 RepID=UPI003AF8545F
MGTGASKEDDRWDGLHRPKPGHQLTRPEPGSVVHVQLTKDGFTPDDLIITSGQVVLDNQLVLEVIGGYDSGEPTFEGQYDIEFNLEGDFRFFSAGIGTGKFLNITVYSQLIIQAEVTDEGFKDNAWQIFQGNTIKWIWSGCGSLRSINEVQLCARHTGVLTTKSSGVEPSKTGSFKKKFESPGMFYFQTVGKTGGQLQLCIVQVKEIQREHKVDVTDIRFNPRILTIEEGDKVWWEWSRLKCKKQHQIIQVQSASLTGSENLSSVRGGFISEGPSRSGMLCHVFKSRGVYYYGDQTIDGLNKNFGIILVKPKQTVHPIEVSAEGFYPELQTICSGDRIQWEWNVDTVINTFSIMLIDSCVAGDGKSGSEVDCNNKCQYLDHTAESLVTCFGVTSVQFNTTGVFQYRISDSTMSVGSCSIIVQPGSQDHFIKVTETGLQPKTQTVHVGDRMWWSWEGSKIEHNIIQVTSSGHPIADGFCSGQPHSYAGAYLYEVVNTGEFFYKSSGIQDMFGSFVVKTQAKVHEVSIANNVILPDPVLVDVNDCVAWLWSQMSKHGVTKVNNTHEIHNLKMYTEDILLPRRCIAKRFTQSGLYHYYSRAFSTKGDKFMDEDISCSILSSVVVSNNPEYVLVNVTKKGFKPARVTIQKGQSIMWTWNDDQEHHNIIYVNSADHSEPYEPVVGTDAFASSDKDKSFLQKFQNYGKYHITSVGAPGCIFIVNVINDDNYVSTPMITSECNGGIVKQWHKVLLKSPTEDATILYTLDGSVPELHSATTRIYKDEQAICLKRPGLVVVRALAVGFDSLNSSIFTSNRFWVLKTDKDDSYDEEDTFSIATEDFEEDELGPTNRWQWWNCVPEIKGWIIEPGAVQVTWETLASEDAMQLQKYQVFIDGVCFRNFIPVTCTSVVVSGLPGGESHVVSVVAVPSERTFLPLESNKLLVKRQVTSTFGGPLVSCLIAENDHSFYLSWPTLDNRSCAVFYTIYANGKQCGHKVQPKNESRQCKVLIEDCELNTEYNFYIQAKAEGSSEALKSNPLELTLPLDTSAFVPPAGNTLVELPFIQVAEAKQKTHCLSKELLPTVDTSMEHSKLLDNFGKPLFDDAQGRQVQLNLHKLIFIFIFIYYPVKKKQKQYKKHKLHRTTTSREKAQNIILTDCQKAKNIAIKDSPDSAGGKITLTRINLTFDVKREEVNINSACYESQYEYRDTFSMLEKPEDDEDNGDVLIERDNVENDVNDDRSSDLTDANPTQQSNQIENSKTILVSKLVQHEQDINNELSHPVHDLSQIPLHDPIGEEMDKDFENKPRDTSDRQHCVRDEGVSNVEISGNTLKENADHTEITTSSSDSDTDSSDSSLSSSSDVNSESMVTESDDKANLILNGESSEPENKANVVLPTPVVVVRTNAKDSSISLQWQCARVISATYTFSHYMVHVEGMTFSGDIQSHGRCEVMDDAGNECIRHSWNADLANAITIKQLMDNSVYRAFVTASFSHSDPKRGTLQTVSEIHQCLTGGRAQAPAMVVKSLGVQEVVLVWKPGICHQSIEIIGYQFYKNGKRKGSIIAIGTIEKCISNIKPGTTHRYQIQSITDDGRNSDLSDHIRITCPMKPNPPNLMVESSSEAYTAQISWSKAKGSKGKVISSYCVYVNGKLHGDVTVDVEHSKATQIRYKLNNLKPGEYYEVTAKTYAGWRTMKPSSDVLCGIMSDESSPLTVCCPAVPASPTPRLAGMHGTGIDITWDAVQPFADAAISGYLLLKDGKPVLPIMDPNTQHHTLSGLVLGTSVTLQIVALTDHPVGRLKWNGEKIGHDYMEEPGNRYFEAEKYSACRPGSKLRVEYTGLVQPPTNVQCLNVTSQSAYITWEQNNDTSIHYISADQHQVTWWATENKDRGVQSQITHDNCLKLCLLEPDTNYTIVVEARKQDNYTATRKGDRNSYTFILSGQSEQVHILTSKPPEAPPHIKLISTTCSSIELAWTKPISNGTQILGQRMYVVTEDDDYCITESHLDLSPDSESAVIPGLMENTTYKLILVVVTKEYFDAVHEKDKPESARSLPEEWVEIPEDSPWLPFVSVTAKTAGTEPPNNLRCVKYSESSVTLAWDAPQYGSDRLLKYVVRWMVFSNKKKQTQSCEGTLEIFTEETVADVKLFPGRTYSMAVEAHLSDFYQASNDGDSTDGYITCLSSDMIQVRIPTPVEPPTLYLKEFTTSSLELHWQKPVLFTALKSSDKSCQLCIHRNLVCYRLIVNGEHHSNIEPSALSCPLHNLTAGKLYRFQIAVITSNTGGSNKQSFDRDDQDESLSRPLEVTLPKYESGNLLTVMASFESNNLNGDKKQEFPELIVTWSVADCGTAEEQGIVGYNLNWMSTADGKEHTATVAPDVLSYNIPVHYQRCVYDVTVNILKEEDMWQDLNTPSIEWIIPGSPDPPIIGCSSITPYEFILEWGTPRLFGGVGIRGYKVYMNDKPIGNDLSVSHHRAVLPCRPNRTYHVSLAALTADPSSYQDSLLSEELQLRSPGNIPECTNTDSKNTASPTHSNSTSIPEDVFINVSKVTDSTISIRWSRPSFEGDENIKRVKIQWSSVLKPKEIEALLKPIASQYTIRNCSSGAAHFVTIFMLDSNDQVINRSKQISIHTAAPIQTPTLSIQSCDFHQCTLKWDKPKVFGDTLLTSYRLKVNGSDLKNLLPQETMFVFTQGRMCRKYSFSIQALCNVRYLNSEISEKVEIEWPGALPPTINRVPTTKAASIKIQWTEPTLTGGAKVAHYRAVLVDESACQNKVQRRAATIMSPVIDPETFTAEFYDLLITSTYKVSLEVHLESLERPVRTRSIATKVAKKPSKPIVCYVVRGVSERQTLEKDACELINKRDKLLQQLIVFHSSQGLRHAAASTQTDLQLSDVLGSLGEVEGYLKQCLEALHAFTGAVEVMLTWEQVRDDGDAVVTGYKVYVNGKQNGFQVHEHVNEMVLKLSAYHPNNKITVVATTNHAVGDSEPSDVIIVNTSPFKPFSSYCFHSIHSKETRFPRVGSCAYIDSLMREISPNNFNNITALHQGFKRRKIPPASVSVVDVFDGSWHLLIPTKITNRNPTVILFWTKWCLASSKILTFFVAYAKKKASMVSCIACCCASNESTGIHRHSLMQVIVGNNWRDDKTIRHCCCCHTKHAGLNPRRQTSSVSKILLASSGKGRRHSTVSLDMTRSSHNDKISVPELFGVIGVPTLVILHPDGHVAWQGRFAAHDLTSFETLLDGILENLTETKSGQPKQTKNEQSLALSSLSSSSFQTITIPSTPPSPERSSSLIIHERNLRWLERPKTSRQRQPTTESKADKKISINNRPYTSARSKPPRSQARPKSSLTI